MLPTALIVDDDRINRYLFSRVVERIGYAVTESVDGIDAEAKITELRPDLVLLDIMMPLQDGYQTCVHVREKGYRGIIIMISASESEDIMSLCKASGADDFLEKPVRKNTLENCINAHTAKH